MPYKPPPAHPLVDKAMTDEIKRIAGAVAVGNKVGIQAALGSLVVILVTLTQRLAAQAAAYVLKRQDEDRKRIEVLERRIELTQRLIVAVNTRIDQALGLAEQDSDG